MFNDTVKVVMIPSTNKITLNENEKDDIFISTFDFVVIIIVTSIAFYQYHCSNNYIGRFIVLLVMKFRPCISVRIKDIR